jgi:hypothetical protein
MTSSTNPSISMSLQESLVFFFGNGGKELGREKKKEGRNRVCSLSKKETRSRKWKERQ